MINLHEPRYEQAQLKADAVLLLRNGSVDEKNAAFDDLLGFIHDNWPAPDPADEKQVSDYRKILLGTNDEIYQMIGSLHEAVWPFAMMRIYLRYNIMVGINIKKLVHFKHWADRVSPMLVDRVPVYPPKKYLKKYMEKQ